MDDVWWMTWILPPDCVVNPAAYIIVALAAFVMTGVSKGGFGGVGVLAVPMMMMVAPAELVLGMWLPLLILCDICTIRSYPKQWDPRPILLLTPWMLAGIVVGWLVLRHYSDDTTGRATQWIKVFVGGLAVFFALMEVVRIVVARRIAGWHDRPAWRPTWLTTAPFGLVGGVSTMLAHSAGAVTAIYLLAQRMDRRVFAGTSGRYYFLFNTLKVPFYALGLFGLEYITLESLRLSLWLVPLAPLTVWAGSELNRHMSPTAFNKVVYVLLAIGGFYLIYENAFTPP